MNSNLPPANVADKHDVLERVTDKRPRRNYNQPPIKARSCVFNDETLMDPAEYLAFIPLLFYGIALADLLMQWRRFFDSDDLCWPYLIITVLLTEIAIWNVYQYLEVVSGFDEIGYYRYWLYLIQPVLFLLTISALVPDSDQKDVNGHFERRLPLIFSLMAMFVASHFVVAFGNEGAIEYFRMVVVGLCLVIIITRNTKLVYLFGLCWLASLFFRGM